jgi:hypothetical protein
MFSASYVIGNHVGQSYHIYIYMVQLVLPLENLDCLLIQPMLFGTDDQVLNKMSNISIFTWLIALCFWFSCNGTIHLLPVSWLAGSLLLFLDGNHR